MPKYHLRNRAACLAVRRDADDTLNAELRGEEGREDADATPDPDAEDAAVGAVDVVVEEEAAAAVAAVVAECVGGSSGHEPTVCRMFGLLD